ncbi:MAG: type II toxin-antitoxin system mRNA interferase toxin, RelE/StbE family [Candidatus Desantisbacteria bacterium]
MNKSLDIPCLKYYPQALRRIENLDAHICSRLEEEINELRLNPYGGKSLKGKLKGKYSWRFGDYRIIYKIEKEPQLTIVICGLGHRQDVYKIATRLLQLILSL